MTHRRWRAFAATVTSLLLLALTVVVPSGPAQAADGSSSVTKSETVERTYLDNGTKTVVDKRNVSVTVDTTTGLRSLQLVHVSWTGAHPTGGIVADQNSDLAQNEEYPFVLFECRGTDTAAHPITPSTCWTQYADERFDYGSDDPAYPAWRSDARSSAADRGAIAGAPAVVPSACSSNLFGSTYQRWVPFAAADGHTYAGGPFGCGGLPPEASPANLTSNLALPSNETFGVTDRNGNGSAAFDIFTAEDHPSLGCSATVACTLVAVPILGISCDPAGSLLPADQRPAAADVSTAQANCESTGNFAPGEMLPSQAVGDPAVDGSLWWSASNWENRISIPLTFAQADNLCSLNASAVPVPIYGSELMIQATTQWAPAFCLNPKLFDLTHVQTPEPQARNLLATNNVPAIYTSDPPDTPYPSPTVNAPVAVTGFGIAFAVDGKDGQPVTSLRLDARLLAKLLTESYPAEPFIRVGDKGLENNPYNMSQDPEFQELNPGLPISAADAAATLLTVNSQSDVMYALTSYINADPQARAWLDGKPDPWGMVVNPAYKGIQLPVNNWQLLDNFIPLAYYKAQNVCLAAAPVPYLPLLAAPTARLFSIGQDMQFALAQTQNICITPSPIPNSTAGAKMVATGRQQSGHHFMLGVVSLGDAAREGLSLASLQSTDSATVDNPLVDANGRTFVAPTPTSLHAAAQTLTPNAKTGVWDLSYDGLRSNAAAYPGTMVVYAAVPTSGLPASEAKDYSELLSFAAGPGQQPGIGQGLLPGGYLPMTSANDLGGLAAYTLRAAKAVAAQRGYLPSLTKPDPVVGPGGNGGGTKSPGGTGNNGGNGGSGSGSGSGGGSGNGGGSTPTGSGGNGPSGHSSPSSSAGGSVPGNSASPAAFKTPRVGAGFGGWAVPAILLVALVAGLACVVTRFVGGMRAR